jgi:hypothetical protein
VIGRNLFGVFAMLAVAGLMSAGNADAKACKALCRTQIKACYQTCTTPPKKSCKADCRSHFVGECKLSAPKAKDRTCPASPSGAFLD